MTTPAPQKVVLPNLEYIKYIEPHLSTKIVSFLLTKTNNEMPFLKSLNEKLLTQTNNFEEMKNQKIMEEEKIQSIKEENEKEIAALEEKLKGFLMLSENCEKQNNHDLNYFSLGKKIIEETSPAELIKYATKLFDTKNFSKAASILKSFAIFHENSPKTKSKMIYALYLLFCVKIYMDSPADEVLENFENILTHLEKFNLILDEKFKKNEFDSMSKVQVDFKEILLYRGYLVHWALFIIKYSSGLFLETLFNEKYFPLLENSFPYLLKYLIVFSIINKNRKFVVKLQDTILKKRNKIEKRKDFFIVLLENMFVKFDFHTTLKNLEQCKGIMSNDYFLKDFVDVFDKKVKDFILENYLILNQCVDLNEIKDIFNGDQNLAKNKITELIHFYYPNSTIQIFDNEKKLEFSNDDDEINNFYKIKTEELFSLTGNMVQYFSDYK